MVVKVKLNKELDGMFDALDSHGGHIVICLFLLALGATFIKADVPKGDDLIVFALGVLARSMYGSSERKQKRLEGANGNGA